MEEDQGLSLGISCCTVIAVDSAVPPTILLSATLAGREGRSQWCRRRRRRRPRLPAFRSESSQVRGQSLCQEDSNSRRVAGNETPTALRAN